MKLGDISPQDDLSALPRIPREEIRLLWASDSWDNRVLSGMLSYKDKKYFFQMQGAEEWKNQDTPFDGNDYPAPKYLIIELSTRQLEEEEYWHTLFREKVWNAWEYGEDQKLIKRGHPELLTHWTDKSMGEYKQAVKDRKPMDLSANTVIGWFER